MGQENMLKVQNISSTELKVVEQFIQARGSNWQDLLKFNMRTKSLSFEMQRIVSHYGVNTILNLKLKKKKRV